MDDEIPPLISAPGEPPRIVARWRWCVHVVALALFPLIVGSVAYIQSGTRETALLPAGIGGLISVSLFELVFFGVFFFIAWLASRATARELLLQWRGGPLPVIRGFLYSVLLRVTIGIIVSFALVFWLKATSGGAADVNKLAPQTDRLVDATALVNNPIYFALTLTLMSFVVAGFREEVWRSGMLAGLGALFPRAFGGFRGQLRAVIVAAVLFGLGHTAQGWGAVVITALLGVGLGAIMIWHRSIWDAVIAHGFFDASTFLFLYGMAKYRPDLLHGG